MCGIFALVTKTNKFNHEAIRQSTRWLLNRGPDHFGIQKIELSCDRELWLVQYRLAIIDLDPRSNQPFEVVYNGRRYWLVFNGEVYNYKELAEKYGLQNKLSTRSDTEVVAKLIAQFGTKIIPEFRGMFAAVMFDESTGHLLAFRDQFGKKPIFQYNFGNSIGYSSDLRCFKSLGMQTTVSLPAERFYRRYGYTPGNSSIYEECAKLPAGSFSTVYVNHSNKLEVANFQYFDPLKPYSKEFAGSYNEALEEFEVLFDHSVKLMANCDVETGVLLSGGVDSSLIAASLAAQKLRDVSLWTVAFENKNFDESLVAQNTARRLHLECNFLKFNDQIASNCFNYFIEAFDEPFSDSSALPTLGIASLAKKSIKVALGGDGGDELFLGYKRYRQAQIFGQMCNALQNVMPTRFTAFLLSHLFQDHEATLQAMTKDNLGQRIVTLAVRSAEAWLRRNNQFGFYDALITTFPCASIRAPSSRDSNDMSLFEWAKTAYPMYSWESLEGKDIAVIAGALDFITYMREDGLVKTDRSFSRFGMELRCPFLSVELHDFASSLPVQWKLKLGVGKKILRDALNRRIAGDLSKLRKRGFGIESRLLRLQKPALMPCQAWNESVLQSWYST